jgi:replicative DNA helicase
MTAVADHPVTDRTPPQDTAAEQCVLGGMMLSKDAIADVVEILRGPDFYRPAHALIYDTILDLNGRGEPADIITVAAALQDAGNLTRVGGAPYLHTLISTTPTAANSGWYARTVAERAVLRRLVQAGTQIVQWGYAPGTDVDDAVDRAQQAVYDVTERRSSDDVSALADLFQPTLDEIEAVGGRNGVMSGIPTGFADLDRLLNGLHPGQLVIIGARPGLGKALALDTPLPTPDGWTTMGAVQAGDTLLGSDGQPTTVVHAFDILRDRPCYQVRFSDGSVITADADHQWQVQRHAAFHEVWTTRDLYQQHRAPVADQQRLRRTYVDQDRYVKRVRPCPTVPVRCVTVDSPDHLYLAGPTGIPTHNSTLGLDFARAASIRNNLASVIFSLEMSKIEIVTRLLSAEARVPLHVLRSGQLGDDDWTRLARRMGEINEAPIFIDDSPNMTLMEIRAKARRLRQNHNLKLIVVDYLQLMTSPTRVENRQQEVSAISRGLKLLARELEVPVVALTQLNRNAESRQDHRPMLSDLRESGSQEQDADVVILVHRDDYYDKESPRAGEADLLIVKHRNGPTDTITVAAQLHFSRFVDLAIL